jgi:hyperosmotically inducible periplasmic protein
LLLLSPANFAGAETLARDWRSSVSPVANGENKEEFTWEDHLNGKKLIGFIAGAMLIALVVVGCETATNTNTNTNMATSNANMNANVNANANTNMNANRRAVNANISREEYEREKESFAEDAKRLGRTIGTGANDGWLWTKTRAVLATTDDLRDSTINVDVDNAIVTLSGTVATQAQKTKAGKVAKGVEGVKSVKNNLVVSANP